MHGEKLAGLWELVRISKPGAAKQDQWMLFKKRGDAWARPLAEYDVITALPDSVIDKPLGPVEEREPERATVERVTPPPIDESASMALAETAPLPPKLTPQLATLAAMASPGVAWVVENKFDGYRLLARVDDRKVQLFTRNGHDWTSKLQNVATAVAALGIGSGWLDGEIVVMNANGMPDFNALQNSIDNARTNDVVYFVFDLPFQGGKDLRQLSLVARRAHLQALVGDDTGTTVRFSQAFDVAPAQMLAAACELGMEGVIAKRADAPYVSARTETWLKLKCGHRQEFVVIGFTERAGASGEVGGLLLGYHGDDGTLRSAGSVGTGWNSKTGQELYAALTKLKAARPAVDAATLVPGRWSKRVAGTERWVNPQMVVEVAFGEWTPDGNVRHPVFKGGACRQAGHPNHPRDRFWPARPFCQHDQIEQDQREGDQPRTRDRPQLGLSQGRPGALLRVHRRLHPAPPQGSAGIARARARRDRRQVVLPEARRGEAAGIDAARRGSLARPRRAPGGRHRPGARVRCAE